MAFCEVSQDQSPGTPAAAGDFGFKVLTASDPAEKTKKLSAELANGRLVSHWLYALVQCVCVRDSPRQFLPPLRSCVFVQDDALDAHQRDAERWESGVSDCQDPSSRNDQ